MAKLTDAVGTAYILSNGFEQSELEQMEECLAGYKFDSQIFPSLENAKDSLKYSKLLIAYDDDSGLSHKLSELHRAGYVFKELVFKPENYVPRKTLMRSKASVKNHVTLKKPFNAEIFKKTLEELVRNGNI